MFDEKELWKQRFNKTSRDFIRYLKYILNGHMVIVFVFLLGTVAFYYQEWLEELSPEFPAAVIMAILIGMLVTYSPIYTFLVNADKVFLIPLEYKLTSYFIRSIMVSFVFHAYFLLMVLGICMPLYARVNSGDFSPFIYFLIILFIMKMFNLLIKWSIQYYVELKVHYIDILVRFSINVVLLYLLFSNASVIFLLMLITLLFTLYIFFGYKIKDKGLKWEFLIDQEEKRMTSFYRLANMFTDVPILKDRVKRRKWMDWIFRFVPFHKDSTFSNLYLRTFIRSGDYLGLWLRLSFIGVATIYYFSFGIGNVVFALLFIYLTGFQLLSLWNHYQYKLWIDLYPVDNKIKEASFLKLISIVLITQSILLASISMIKGELFIGVITVITGSLFTYFFVYLYSRKKIHS